MPASHDDVVLAGLIGSGIGASLTPTLHEHEGAAHGLRYTYQTVDSTVLGFGPERLPHLLRAAHEFGFRGLNITHPFKREVLAHLDALSPDAENLGSVNTVVFDGGRTTGHNTDWSGFAQSFRRGLPGADLTAAVQVGAGGAGAAVAHAALTLGTEQLSIIDVDLDRSTALAGQLADRFGADRVRSLPAADLEVALKGATGLIHATPIGMVAHPGSAVPSDFLHDGLWVAEVVYRPLRTQLLIDAGAAGCRTLDGGGMAVFQAADAFRLFTGLEPDIDRMLADFAELLLTSP